MDEPQILIVEDDQQTLKLLELVLENDANVHLAESAEDALGLIDVAPNPFDLLIIDIHLEKGIDGTEFLTRVRALDSWGKVPAIACTAYAMPGDREKLLNAGFDYYVSKPFRKQELSDTIEQALVGG